MFFLDTDRKLVLFPINNLFTVLQEGILKFSEVPRVFPLQHQNNQSVKNASRIIQNYNRIPNLNKQAKSMLLVSFLILLANLSQQVHSCIHDQIISGHKMVAIDDREDFSSGRFLQIQRNGGMRIHYEYNTTDIQPADTLGRNIIKIMNIVASFWQKTIEMPQKNRLSFNIDQAFNRNNFTCLKYKVPISLIDNGVPEKDFGILVQARDDGDNGVTAYSIPCAYSVTDKRPMWGLIHWNKNYIKMDPLSFQENLHIATHELIHLFGFSNLLFPLFKRNPIVQIGSTTYLNGPYISQELVRQYGCLSPPGMPLQGGGGMGTALSHWSRKVASNQLMTAGVSASNPTISYLTLAVLEETGWYTKIYKSFAKFINYGYRKGCGFLNPSNCSSEEYCHLKGELQCNYDRVSLGYCKNDSLSNCLYVKYYLNFICIDPNYESRSLNSKEIGNTGEKGGRYSRCFTSDLHKQGTPPTKYSFRCFQTFCYRNYQHLAVKIGNQAVLCLFPNQKVRVPGFQGLLTCPKSFRRSCAVIRCPNQCNANGVCLNGVCLCENSYTGEDCSQVSSVGLASTEQIFVASENNNCPAGTYRDQFGDCDFCPKNCTLCASGEECLRCFNSQLPVDGHCPS